MNIREIICDYRVSDSSQVPGGTWIFISVTIHSASCSCIRCARFNFWQMRHFIQSHDQLASWPVWPWVSFVSRFSTNRFGCPLGIGFAGLIADGSGFAIIPTEIQKYRNLVRRISRADRAQRYFRMTLRYSRFPDCWSPNVAPAAHCGFPKLTGDCDAFSSGSCLIIDVTRLAELSRTSTG